MRKRKLFYGNGTNSFGLQSTRRSGGSVSLPSFFVTVNGLTINPTHGAVAEAGVQLTAVASNFSDGPPTAVAWQWFNSGGEISGANAATYTPLLVMVLDNIYARATPDGEAVYAARNSPAYIVRAAPPQVTGAPADLDIETDNGIVSIDYSTFVTGDNLVYDVASDLVGVSFNATTGLTSFDPDNGAQSGSIVATISNTGGPVQITTLVDVSVPVVVPASGPTISAVTPVDLNTVSADVTAPVGVGTLSNAITVGGGLDGAAIEAAVSNSGSDLLDAATVNVTTDTTGLTAGTVYILSLVAKDDNGYGAVFEYSFTLIDVPATMAAPTVTADGTDSVIVTFSPPSTDNGAAVTQYNAYVSSDDGTTFDPVEDVDTGVNIAGQPAGTSIQVYMTSVNEAGESDPSPVGTATTDAAAGFTPQWMQFPLDALLIRGGELTGAPATTQAMTFVLTYRMGATDVGAAKQLVTTGTGTNYTLDFEKASNDKIYVKIEDTTNALVYFLQSSLGLAADTDYMILASVDGVTNGAKGAIVNLATGALHGTLTDTGFNVVPATMTVQNQNDWRIGAVTTGHIQQIDGRLERFMFWADQYADVSQQSVRDLFVATDGALQDPDITWTPSMGGEPIVNIHGSNLADGTNSGTGGNFTKSGAGTITPV